MQGHHTSTALWTSDLDFHLSLGVYSNSKGPGLDNPLSQVCKGVNAGDRSGQVCWFVSSLWRHVHQRPSISLQPSIFDVIRAYKRLETTYEDRVGCVFWVILNLARACMFVFNIKCSSFTNVKALQKWNVYASGWRKCKLMSVQYREQLKQIAWRIWRRRRKSNIIQQ